MWRSVVFLLTVTLHAAICAPQFVSLKDGKVGVNFGGYHAEAGLGGLVTGDTAHGGLGASAGTPFGQEATAGLGGIVNGRAAGSAYAGATAGGNVGASAGLGSAGGEITNSGLGAEAHAGEFKHSIVGNGGGGFQITKQVSKIPQPLPEYDGTGDLYVSGNLAADSTSNVNFADETSVIQRVKPHKKYVVEAAPSNTVVVEKHIEIPKIQAQVGLEVEPAPKRQTTNQVETYQEVASPVKQTSVVATSAIETQPQQQAAFNFQKGFDFNLRGGFVQPPPAVAAAPVIPVAPVAPVAEYNPQVFVYGKHFRPWRHRVHLQKHFAPAFYQPQPVIYQPQPVIYQPQVAPVVQKRKQVVVQAAPVHVPAPVPFPAVGSYSSSINGRVDTGGLFDSIFNIPIATLKAVNGLLNTKVQGGAGIAVEKSANFHYG